MTRPVLGYGREVTQLTRGVLSVDAVGNDIRGELEKTITGVTLWPRTSTENNVNAETVTTDLSMLLPPGVTVSPADRFRVSGLLYTVEGEPAVWSSSPLTGSAAGVQVELRRVTG